ncbi:MAG: TIR domain-containing protein [Methanobacterium sp.]|uniref:toll/interleukin-1 receptor domain-containing protein n=1 Tax=Methanobacterium sp. TaxID=2164 RepID=UPI003D6542E3|nr:TIR domain-containing protein [Methanobacterium sp.]
MVNCPQCKTQNLENATSCRKCGEKLEILTHKSKDNSYDVYISYSPEDKNVADAVCALLEYNNIRCWISPRDIKEGDNKAASIVTAVHNSKIFVLIFSSHSNKSFQVLREVERAVSRGIPIIPFRIEDVEPSGSMEYFISAEHWLDAVTPPLENHIQKLIETITKILTLDERYMERIGGYRDKHVHDKPWDTSGIPWLKTISMLFFFLIILINALYFLYCAIMYLNILNNYLASSIILLNIIVLVLEDFFPNRTYKKMRKLINLQPYRWYIIFATIIIPWLITLFSYPSHFLSPFFIYLNIG